MQTTNTTPGKDYITIDGQKFYIKQIPAIEAERMFFEILPALQSLDISKLPFSFLMELMPYCGVCNTMTNAEIDFTTPDLIGMYVTKAAVLMELQAHLIGKNFSFFSDGSLTRVIAVLSSAFPLNTEGSPSDIKTSQDGAQP